LISDIYSATFGIDINKMYLDRLVTELKDLVVQAKINGFQVPVEYEPLVKALNVVKPILFDGYHNSEIREKFLDVKVDILNLAKHAELLSNGYSSSVNDKPIPDYVKALNKTAKKLVNVLRACSLPVDYAEGYINIDSSSSDTTEASWTISPITPGEKGWSRVDQSKYALFMSGTLDIDLLAIQLGVNPELLDIIDIPYSWDKMLKPVITFRSNAYLNFRSLTKGSDVSIKLYNDIAKIVRFHQSQNESGIIITTSYAMSDAICSELDRLNINFINHKKGTEGVDSIAAYSNLHASGYPTVLVIPAMFEGFDGVHDLCRFVIIPKTPFANTQGPRSKALLEKYPALYAGETVNKLVQGFGRGVRKSNDWCIYYLMDKTVIRILNTLDQQYKAQFERVELNQPKDVVEFKKQFNRYLEQGA
jgi:Rad3-related DNA helicase